MEPASQPYRRLPSPAFAPVAIGLLSAAVGSIGISSRSLWSDEGASLMLSQTLGATVRDHNAAAYYVFLHFFRNGHLPSEAILRAPSLFLFALWNALTVFVAQRYLFSRPSWKWALAVGAPLAFHPLLLARAQDARGYMLAGCALMVSTAALISLSRQRRVSTAAIFVVAAAIAIYSHALALWFVGVQALATFWMDHRGRRFYVGMGAVLAICLAPLLVQMYRAGGEQISWLYRPSFGSVLAFIEELGGGTDIARPLGLALIVAMVVAAFPIESAAPPNARAVSKLLLAVAVAPIAIGVVSSFKQSTINPRYYLFAVPYALMWLVGRLELATAASKLRLMTYFAAVGVILVGAALFHTRSRNEGWKEAYALVRENAEPGDLVAFAGFEAPFVYYVQRDGRVDLARLGPCKAWDLSIDPCRKDLSPDVDALVGKRRRLWLITQGWGFELKEQCDTKLKPMLDRAFQEWPISSAFTDPKYQIVFVNLYET